jgi:hypothetical protein
LHKNKNKRRRRVSMTNTTTFGTSMDVNDMVTEDDDKISEEKKKISEWYGLYIKITEGNMKERET